MRTSPEIGETPVGFHVEGVQDGKTCFEGDFVSVFVEAQAFGRPPPPDRIQVPFRRYLVAQ